MSIDETTTVIEQGNGKKRVLIVEDERMIRETVAMLCEHYGHTADQAEDGVEGLEKYKRGGYNLILTDNNMPRMKGWDMMAEIKLNGNGVPVVLMTSDPNLTVEKARAHGFAHYMSKPFNMSAVHEMIERYAK